jgi:hypothetical protein
MNPWLVMVLAGLGAMKLTNLVKEIIPWPLQPWTRSVVSLVWATALSVGFSDSFRQGLLMAFGSTGLAAIVHEVTSTLSMKSDDLKQTIMMRAVNRRRVS